MRQKDREIKDRKAVDDIIKRCLVCRLAMCADGKPYIIPLNFGYDGGNLYFHCALGGRKVDIIRRNCSVGFEFDILHEIVKSETACKWTTKYESVVGTGKAEIIDDMEGKKVALAWIMRQYGSEAKDFPDDILKKTMIIRVRILEISGKAKK